MFGFEELDCRFETSARIVRLLLRGAAAPVIKAVLGTAEDYRLTREQRETA